MNANGRLMLQNDKRSGAAHVFMNIEGLARVTPVSIDTVDKVKTECLTNAVTKRRAKCESVKVSWNVPGLFACS